MELSESTTPHKKRASSWATLQDLAEEAAEEAAAEETLDGATGGQQTGAAAAAAAATGNDVDIRKTISSPALRQMLSHHRGSASTAAAAAAAAASNASAGMLRIDGRGGGGGGGMGGVALPSPIAPVSLPSGLGGMLWTGMHGGANVGASGRVGGLLSTGQARLDNIGDDQGGGGGVRVPFPNTTNTNGAAGGAGGAGSAAGAGSGTGMMGSNANPDVSNAFNAAAAAAGTMNMNPLQLASMNMIASMNMNLGVKMGLNMARMGAMALTGGVGAPPPQSLQPGPVGGAAGAGFETMMQTSRNNSISELQDVDEEPRLVRATTTMGMGTPTSDSFGNPFASGDDMMDGGGFDAAEFDEMCGGGGGGVGDMVQGGVLFEGHPSVEPKEEGSLKRTFKSCPDFVHLQEGQGGSLLGGGFFIGGGAPLVKTDAMAVDNSHIGSGGGNDGFHPYQGVGAAAALQGVGGRGLVPLAPMASSAMDETFAQGIPSGMMGVASPAAAGRSGKDSGGGGADGVGFGTNSATRMDLSLMQEVQEAGHTLPGPSPQGAAAAASASVRAQVRTALALNNVPAGGGPSAGMMVPPVSSGKVMMASAVAAASTTSPAAAAERTGGSGSGGPIVDDGGGSATPTLSLPHGGRSASMEWDSAGATPTPTPTPTPTLAAPSPSQSAAAAGPTARGGVAGMRASGGGRAGA
ncbi:unnamed protein product, partial [Scytosiphon promiscuus]